MFSQTIFRILVAFLEDSNTVKPAHKGFYLIKMSISYFYNYSINLIAFVKNKFMARITHLRERCACAQVLSRTKLARYRVEHVMRNFISPRTHVHITFYIFLTTSYLLK